MRRNLSFIIMICILTFGLCACKNVREEQVWDVEQYENREDIISIEKLELAQMIPDGVEVSTYRVKYYSDDCTVVSYLSIPKASIEEHIPYPCIIFNRGGNKEFSKNDPRDIAYMAESSGKIIFATQYRGVDGGTGVEEYGGADLNDVLKLVDFCEAFVFVDMEQLYMMGISRGGMMTYMAVREDARIKKAVIVSGLADSFMAYAEREDMQSVYKELVGDTPESNPEAYEKRSATYWANEITCPLLIIHSKLDESVSFEQAEKMVQMLEKSGKEYKFITYEDNVHGLHAEDFSIIMEWCQP